VGEGVGEGVGEAVTLTVTASDAVSCVSLKPMNPMAVALLTTLVPGVVVNVT
jgi:hypothetical protein